MAFFLIFIYIYNYAYYTFTRFHEEANSNHHDEMTKKKLRKAVA